MLNSACIQGRLTATPELRVTTSNVNVTTFTLACDRSYVAPGKERETDFINVVAWRNNADFVCNYFTKGQMMIASGSIQTRTYEDKQGNKRTAVELVADKIDFCGPKESNDKPASVNKPDEEPDEFPF